jgi:hypothetical protein
MKKIVVAVLAVVSLVAAFFAGQYLLNKSVQAVKDDIADKWQGVKNTVTGWFTRAKVDAAA